MRISEEVLRQRKALVASMATTRLPWWQHWRDLADYIMPKRYEWLLSDIERRTRMSKNPNILDGTGTNAARTLAHGMMNGITSPSRPWFKLRLAGFPQSEDWEARAWLDEVERRMLLVFAESNFYNCIATMYLDLGVFATSAMLIYEDAEDVIRCYNKALGEYYLALDERGAVSTFAACFKQTVMQVVGRFGEENCSTRVRTAYRHGGSRLNEDVEITQLIEPNDQRVGIELTGKKWGLPTTFPVRELVWETGADNPGDVLSLRGFHEMPGIFPRWEVTGNDPYGSGSPGMDALGDIIQLQHETRRKGQALDYYVRPPTLVDISLQGRPTSMLPGSQTFVAGLANNPGVKPAYQINPAIQELTVDIRDVQARIRETFHNDLFMMISQLETVRSAAEIDARREEKLIMLGPMLERFGVEALDKALGRTYAIMVRAELLPPAPRSIRNKPLRIQYVGILSAAQTAVGVAPTERFLQLTGNLSPVVPEVLDIPNFDELLYDYAADIGVPGKGINSRAMVAAKRRQRAAAETAAAAAEVGKTLSEGAKNLSQTEVGGGANALQTMIG